MRAGDGPEGGIIDFSEGSTALFVKVNVLGPRDGPVVSRGAGGELFAGHPSR
jgi:hypothetical protein